VKKIAVIGIGNLGLRHLESLVTCDTLFELFAVEPSEANRTSAKNYFASVAEKRPVQEVSFVLTIDELPGEMDVVIIATSANVRLKIIRDLLASKKVRSLILEKVLFQKVSDYTDCAEILKHVNTRTYVNCPMRSYESYHNIRSFFGDDIPVSMSVSGADWSMGCNAVHYLDLFSFFTGTPAVEIRLDLDRKVKESKRPGFIDFTGMMKGIASKSQITLSSIENVSLFKIIVLVAKDKYCIIDEHAKYYILGAAGIEAEMKPFRMPYQSELTARVVEEILETGSCILSSYAESAAVHIPLIEALMQHVKTAVDPELDYVPIT
jgi:hypothetical protein